jgi:excisionase family DNA binding protein
MTTRQAAEELGYHSHHLYKLLRNETIKAGQFNRAWMIDRQEVEWFKALQGKGGRLPKVPKQ